MDGKKAAGLQELIDMYGPDLLESAVGGPGWKYTGFSGQNPAYAMTENALNKRRLKGMRGAADPDALQLTKLLQGGSRLIGNDWGPGQQAHISELSKSIAPFMPMARLAFGDKVMDTLGGRRADIPLADAFLQTNPNLTPEQAAIMAHKVTVKITAADKDTEIPSIGNGYNPGELSQLVLEAAKSGRWPIVGDADEAASRLQQLTAPAAAMRDTMSAQGYAPDPASTLQALERIRQTSNMSGEKNLTGMGLGDKIRDDFAVGKYFPGGGGGVYGAAAHAAGTSQGQLSDYTRAMDATLMQRAAKSATAQLAATTMKLGQDGMLQPGTPGYDRWVKLQQAKWSPIDRRAWMQEMQRSLKSDVRQRSPKIVSALLSMPAATASALTPTALRAVRASQVHDFDIARTNAKQLYPKDPALQRSYLTQFTEQSGWPGTDSLGSLEQMEHIHNPKTHAKVPGIMQQAKDFSQYASSTTHLRSKPVQRFFDQVRNADQDTSFKDVARGTSGMVRTDQLPDKLPQLPGLPPLDKAGHVVEIPPIVDASRSLDFLSMHVFLKRAEDIMSEGIGNKMQRGATNAILKAIGVKTPKQVTEEEKTREQLRKAVNRNLRERQARRIAAKMDSLTKTSEDRPPTVAIDLDGTLAKMCGKFNPKQIEDPRKGAKAAMERFKKLGFRVIIFTVRGDKAVVKNWLNKHEIPYDYINENPDQPADASDKIIADVYVDDRGVDARKSWASLSESVSRRLKRIAA